MDAGTPYVDGPQPTTASESNMVQRDGDTWCSTLCSREEKFPERCGRVGILANQYEARCLVANHLAETWTRLVMLKSSGVGVLPLIRVFLRRRTLVLR